jgi:hypothetical protein
MYCTSHSHEPPPAAVEAGVFPRMQEPVPLKAVAPHAEAAVEMAFADAFDKV